VERWSKDEGRGLMRKMIERVMEKRQRTILQGKERETREEMIRREGGGRG
jgi:hypothetical protein